MFGKTKSIDKLKASINDALAIKSLWKFHGVAESIEELRFWNYVENTNTPVRWNNEDGVKNREYFEKGEINEFSAESTNR